MTVLKMAFLKHKPIYPAIRYWLACALLIAGLAYGIHRYFEYRNVELDRRLEMIK